MKEVHDSGTKGSIGNTLENTYAEHDREGGTLARWRG